MSLEIERLENRIREELATFSIPGLAISVIVKGELQFQTGFGVTSVENKGSLITPQTLFRFGSITKVVTAVLIMRLVEANRIALDRPLGEYVPFLQLSEPNFVEQITLRMLLGHTSGLANSSEPFGNRNRDEIQKLLAYFDKYDFIAKPGKFRWYSNPGVSLAGYVTELIMGRTYHELVQEFVLTPLDMKITTFDPLKALTYPCALAHDFENGVLSVRHEYVENTNLHPAGFLISNVEEISNLTLMLLNKGIFRNRRVLSEASIDEMFTPFSIPYTKLDAANGIVFFLDQYRGKGRIYHSGHISTFSSHFVLIPEDRFGVVITCNRFSNPDFDLVSLTDYVADNYLDFPSEATTPPILVDPTEDMQKSLVGTYLGDWSGIVQIRQENDQLFLEWDDETGILKKSREDFYFAVAKNRSIPVGIILGDNPIDYIFVEGSFCRRIDPVTVAGLHAQWDEPTWVGHYKTNFDTLEVLLRDSDVYIKSSALGNEFHCRPIGKDTYACKIGIVQFIKNESSIDCLKLARSITFERV